MAKASTRPESLAWNKTLNEREVRQALDDATIDCHDEDEQHSGLLTMIQEELAFPFQRLVVG